MNAGAGWSLPDIIASALCAAIGGADSWVHIELFGKSRRARFEIFRNDPTAYPTPTPLGLLELKGCIGTIDAMGCQTAIARAIVARAADCRPAVKENRPIR